MTADLTEDLRRYAADEILRDGSSIHVRAIRPDDKDRLTEHFGQLSPRSVYYRFFGVKRRLSVEDLQRFTELDFVRDVGLAATLRQDGCERFIGIGRYFSTAPERAEVAFAVLDSFQGRGIGTLLLEHLSRIAQASGILEFEADVLGENNQMLSVFRHSGFRVRRSLEEGVVHVSFPTAPTEEFVLASEQRDREAAAQSILPFLAPRTVAVIGAMQHEEDAGAVLLRHLAAAGFRGELYPVRPGGGTIGGRRAFAALGAIDGTVDLALIVAAADEIETLVDDCARAGVRSVVLLSSGSDERTVTGAAIDRQLRERVRGAGMRLIGPSSLGVINTSALVQLNASFAPGLPSTGNVGVLSQSGAVGLALLDHVGARGIGLSSFVSVGNKADVSGNDLLAYWSEDPATEVVALYLESFGNPRTFARLAPAVARHKPIVAVKSRRHRPGSEAGSDVDVAFDALFEQAGVIRTDTLEQLLDVTTLLSTQPLPRGSRLAILTNAAGPGVLLADAWRGQGLELPSPSLSTCEELSELVGRSACFDNPIDLLPSSTDDSYRRALEILGRDPVFDAVVAIHTPMRTDELAPVAAAIADGAQRVPEDKPVLAVLLTSQALPPLSSDSGSRLVPCFHFPENAALALAAVERYGRWRRRERGNVCELDRFARETIRAVIERVLGDTGDEGGWLSTGDLATVLRAAGIPVAATEEATVADAIQVADKLGYPLVVKLGGGDGRVITGLESPEALAQTIGSLGGVDGPGADELVLQRQIEGGIEASVEVRNDPTFGPLLICRLGGAIGELLREASVQLLPVSDGDAEAMVVKLRTSPLLDGFRGQPPGDRRAFVDLIRKVSALAAVLPELSELQLRSLKVLTPGRGCIAVDGRMRVRPPGIR